MYPMHTCQFTIMFPTKGNKKNGKCEEDSDAGECKDSTKPFCPKTPDLCIINSPQCVEDIWVCVEIPIQCDDGQYCKLYYIKNIVGKSSFGLPNALIALCLLH